MKENYNRKNRDKYYLKCHLVFCVKYRRKIVNDRFDSDIKAIFLSIADNSDFDIDIMEIDKDHTHFLISYVNSKEVETGKYGIRLEFAWLDATEVLLERENIVVRRLFRLFNRRSQSEHSKRIY